jgi:alkaline phosphatase D
MNIIFKLIVSIGILVTAQIIFSLGMWVAKAQEYRNIQYKKQNRDQITAIVKGDVESALKYSQDYLDKYPKDLEALYIESLAYTQMNEIDMAMSSLRKALSLGMPFGRFLSGPRNLFQKLYASDEFQILAQDQNISMIHGPVLGAVTATSARIWLRTAIESKVRISILDKKGRDEKIISGMKVSSKEQDYTCKVDVEGLIPNTRYFYQVEINGKIIPVIPQPFFQTFPQKGKSTRFKIGFGGGAGYTPWYERIWLTILKRSPRAFLFLGDNVYIDTPEISETQRYCYYRRQSRPEYRQFTAVTPIYAIWDDHDFGTDDCTSSQSPNDPPWKMSVLKVFTENFINPYYGGNHIYPGCWFSFCIGDVDFIMLDCRFYRQNPIVVDEPSMLGSHQKQWLFNKLKESKGTFKIICSSVPWAAGTKPGSKDTWDGYPIEREQIFSFIEEYTIEGVLLLSADRHRSDAWKIDRKESYGLYDLMSSRLTNIHTHPVMKGSLFGYNQKCSFGLLTFDTTKDDPEVVYQIVNIDNEIIYTLTINRRQLIYREK